MNRDRVQAARRHAKARASARFGVVLNSDALRVLVADIQNGRTTHISGKRAIAVYGKKNQCIHTFLSLEQARETLERTGERGALEQLQESIR
jgi:hypothetical protein